MKPKNFPYRKLRRLKRMRLGISSLAPSYGSDIPKDIRIRLGSSGWQQVIREQTS